MNNSYKLTQELLIDLLFRTPKLVIKRIKLFTPDINSKNMLVNSWLTIIHRIWEIRLTEKENINITTVHFNEEQWQLLSYVSSNTFEYISQELIKFLNLSIKDEEKNTVFWVSIMLILEKLHRPSINDFKSLSLTRSYNLETGFRILFSSEKEKLNLIQKQFKEINFWKEKNTSLAESFSEMITFLQKSNPIAATNTMILIKCNEWKQTQIINDWWLRPSTYTRFMELLFQKPWLIYAIDKATLLEMKNLFTKVDNSAAKKSKKIKNDITKKEEEDPSLTIVRKIFSETNED